MFFKKRFVVASFIVVALLVGVAWAVPFYNSNQVTLAWDAVTTDVDGDPIVGVTYRLWLANADTDPNKTAPVVAADSIAETTQTITLGTKGRYFVGCQAVLDDLESVINWADEIENMEGSELFALRFAVPPHGPKKIHR